MALYLGNNKVKAKLGNSSVILHTLEGYYGISNGNLLWASNKNYIISPSGTNTGYFLSGIKFSNLGKAEVLFDRYTAELSGGPIGFAKNDTSYKFSLYYYLSPTASYRQFCFYLPNRENCVSVSMEQLDYIMEKGINLTLQRNNETSFTWKINDFISLTQTCVNVDTEISCLSGWSTDRNGYYSWQDRKIRNIKLYDLDGTLVRHFVPVPQGLQIGSLTVPSNGMFDIVEQKFYGNAGTGTFLYGRDE